MTGRDLHIFPCWQTEQRYPGPGDRSLCGLIRDAAPYPGVPFEGNEDKACPECLSLVTISPEFFQEEAA